MSADDQEQMMVDDWRAAVEDLKDNLRHEIITLTNLARELTNIAYPIADVLEQHIRKVGPFHSARSVEFATSLPCCYLDRAILLTLYTGASPEKTTSHLSARLHCEERWHSLYALFRQEPVPDVHGGLRVGRPEDTTEARGNAADLEGARPWLHRLNACLPSRCYPPD